MSIFDIGSLISGIINAHNLDKWAKCIITSIMAGIVSYCVMRGAGVPGAYYSGVHDMALAEMIGVGAGWFWAGISTYLTWQKLAPKGAEIQLPSAVAGKITGTTPSGGTILAP